MERLIRGKYTPLFEECPMGKRKKLDVWRKVLTVTPSFSKHPITEEDQITLEGLSPFDIKQNFVLAVEYEVFGAYLHTYPDSKETTPVFLVKNKDGVIKPYAMEGFRVVKWSD